MESRESQTIAELEARFWSGNRKASQIWGQIGPDLKERGFVWPIFLRLLRMKRDLIVLHECGELSLTLFIGEIELAAKGPIGSFILQRGG